MIRKGSKVKILVLRKGFLWILCREFVRNKKRSQFYIFKNTKRIYNNCKGIFMTGFGNKKLKKIIKDAKTDSIKTQIISKAFLFL